MHIAIDVRSLMEGRHSGVEEYTTQIIRAMSVCSPKHTYHLFYNSAKEVTLPSFRENVVVHSFGYPNKVLNASQLLFRAPRWDKLVGQHIDVLFVPNPRLTPISPQLPLVTVAHDVSFEYFPEFLTLRRRMWHHLMRPRELFRRSDHIIAVSEHTKWDLVDAYAINPHAIDVVYSGVRPAAAPVRPMDVQKVTRIYNLPSRFLLFMGTMEPRKNILGVVEAFSAIAGHVEQHLVIAGEAGWKMDSLHKKIQSLPYSDRIHMVGYVHEHDKDALYSAADLFIYPSFYEGFGFPPLEALLAGTPSVVSFNSSLPEVVGQYATMVDPYNTSQIASVLQELLVSPQRVPVRVQQEIREKYSWDRAGRETVKILESVV
jgi:glycosyltransferase involved in cell wall biosynthesis